MADTRTSWIVNRGYTGHEHLDVFGIINMNGRVYDPLTAQFFSPDPYVQAPDNWLNYNRYTYCYGNPFRYTDPSGELQIGPYYLSLNLGWSKNGEFSFGISAGVGLENTASVGISLGFGSSGNFFVTLNGNLGGGYAYAGFDTKGGFIAGAGLSVISPFSMWSPISINSNIFSIGADYSSNGGFSGNWHGISITKNGGSFDPSIGCSVMYHLTPETIISDTETVDGVVPLSEAKNGVGTDAQVNDVLKDNNINPATYHDKIAGMQEQLPATAEGRTRGTDGVIRRGEQVIGGTTIQTIRGLNQRSSITFMSPHSSSSKFLINLAHEFVHSDMFYNWGYKNKKSYDKIKEYYAYKVNSNYYNIGFNQTMENVYSYNSFIKSGGRCSYTFPNFPFLKHQPK